MSGPYTTVQPSAPSQSRATVSTVDSDTDASVMVATLSSFVRPDRCRIVNGPGGRFQSVNAQFAGDKLWE